MPQLISLVCRLNLRDKRLIRENEPFECGEDEAEILIRGGMAGNIPVAKQAGEIVVKREVIKAKIVEKQPEPEYTPDVEYIPEPAPAEKIYNKTRKKR